MNKSLFRKKTIERVTSPEQLNDYIRVASPRVWIIIAAVLLLLTGIVVWGIFGTVKVTDSQGNIDEIHPISFVIN